MSNHTQQELAERVDAASAKARELKAELEVAQRRISDLISEKEASRAAAMARPSAPGRGRKTARQIAGGKAILAAGLGGLSVALLAWGAVTVIQFASSEPIPPVAEASGTNPAPSAADLEQPRTEPAASLALSSPATGGLDPDGAPPAGPQDLAAAQQQVARLTAEVEASDVMIARLRDELQLARQAAEARRNTAGEAGPGEAEADTAPDRRELLLAVAVSKARVAELQREMEAARQEIQGLRAAARESGAERPQQADDVAAVPVIEEVLTAAEIPPESPTAETAALQDTVSPDDLLLAPSHHFGREVVVTGSVVWLLRRYWLQADSANRSLLIDVDGLRPDVRSRLKEAVEKIDHLAEARARITGTVERQGAESYRLAATDLVLVE